VRALLKRCAERIDGATLRERVLIFAACALLLVFLANAALLGPLRAKQKGLEGDIARRQAELRNLQGELQRLAGVREVDPDSASRKQQVALRAELAALNARIAAEQRRFTPPERMRGVLEELLERNKRLALVELKTLPPSPLGEAAPGSAGRGIFRHGVELTVSGTYFDLYEYLSALERLPTQLYWGRAELSAGGYPVSTLKLTVYTVSLDKAWLIV